MSSLLDAVGTTEVKCVVVGDGAAGKTCMLVTYTTNHFPEGYVPTLYDVYKADVPISGFGEVRNVSLSLWDIAGQEDFKDLRPHSYKDVDVFVVCFSLSSRASYENVASRWHSELKGMPHTANVPMLLVGTMLDLRGGGGGGGGAGGEGGGGGAGAGGGGGAEVSAEDGEAMARRIGAFKYMECSSRDQTNLKAVFDEAILHVLQAQQGGGGKGGKGAGGGRKAAPWWRRLLCGG